jgi:poly(A) polymerase
MDIHEVLQREGVRYYLSSFSALDTFFRMKSGPDLFIYTEATLAELARVIPNLEFPGLDQADAAVRTDDGTVFLCTADSSAGPPRTSFTQTGLLYDPVRRVFRDPYDAYHDLRKPDLEPSPGLEKSRHAVHEASVLVSRYHYRVPEYELGPERVTLPTAEEQRALLTAILTGNEPWNGLDLLMREGLLAAYWPELFQMDRVDHSKEYHPEGNVWQHTLETFKYRKSLDLVLALGLFLHDVGKPIAQKSEGKPFDGHAELGASISERMLRRLGYSEEIVEQVTYLVRNHMIPGALTGLPTVRVEKIMASPLFPVLLELYRCDLSSTYRGPGGYYEACNVYKAFLKHTRNPFRSADGKKLVRLYVE